MLVKRLDPLAILPTRSNPRDAGLDLYSIESLFLGPGDSAAVRTGIAVAIPDGYVGLVCPRSGLARQYQLTVTNAPGVIDSGFRGEVLVLLTNLGKRYHTIVSGDRIAQLVVVPLVALSEPEWADELPEHDGRGEGGFGSSGR